MYIKYGLYGGFILLVAHAIISMIRCLIYQAKLFKYLQAKHIEKWKYLTTVWRFGPGCVNNIRGIGFLFSKDDLGDPEVLRLKVIVRNAFIHTVTGFPAAFIWGFIMLILLRVHKILSE